jgi:D-alanyl-D-alanine carboxypeptidase
MTRALLVLFLALGHIPVAAATRGRAVRPSLPQAPAALVTAAHQAAEAALKAGVPAVQIAVSHGGQIIYSEAFGVTDIKSATAATSRSIMQIASITKEFTAAAILRLGERGALTLDDRIEKFVPEFNARGAKITLRHLLTHTSGIRRDWLPPTLNPTLPVTREQVIKGINEQPFDFAPGQKWSYSSAGFMLLGYAIESITGRPFPDFIHDEFAVPLGLIDTGVCGTFNLPLPEGYGAVTLPSGPAFVRMDPFHPSVVWSSGSLCSTASDLARWPHFLANGGGLLPGSYATMITPVPLENKTFAPNPYALGVVALRILGRPAVSHAGAIPGFQSYLVYFSDEDLAVAVLTNAFSAPAAGDPELIAITVANAALPAP